MPLIRLERHGDTAVVRFDRPPANAFNLEFTAELQNALEQLVAHLPAGGVVVTGAGQAFSGGVDFKAVPTYSPEQRESMIGHINATITALYELPTATVVAVNGHAIGGAFVVCLACDVRLAADVDMKIGLTEITAGIPYPACPMEVVKAEIEPGLRRHLVLSGAIINAHTAHAHGLIDELVAPDALMERAIGLARARAAARSYARVKEQLRRDTLSRMREIIAAGSDPMIRHWV